MAGADAEEVVAGVSAVVAEVVAAVFVGAVGDLAASTGAGVAGGSLLAKAWLAKQATMTGIRRMNVFTVTIAPWRILIVRNILAPKADLASTAPFRGCRKSLSLHEIQVDRGGGREYPLHLVERSGLPFGRAKSSGPQSENWPNCSLRFSAAGIARSSCSLFRQRMMVKNESKSGPLHKAPADLRKALGSEATTQEAWKDLTPLARNEWICWVISAKQGATRNRRIQRAVEELQAGKRRPCCWPGCPHRRPSAKKWFERRVR